MYKDSLNNTYTVDDLNHLERFPDGATFSHLDLRGSLISGLPRNLHVTGNLDLSYTPRLTTISEGTRVEGNLVLEGSKLEELPDHLTVGTLILNNLITKLPNDLTAGYLDLTKSNVTQIGTKIKVTHLAMTDMPLTNRIECECVSVKVSPSLNLDCTNLNAKYLQFLVWNDLVLANLNCYELSLVRYVELGVPDHAEIHIIDSTIHVSTRIQCSLNLPFSLRFTNVQNNLVHIQCQHDSETKPKCSSIQVENSSGDFYLDLKDKAKDCQTDTRLNLAVPSLFGNLTLAGSLHLLKLNPGLVYGNLTIPEQFEATGLSCLGHLKYSDPQLESVSI